MKYEEALRRGGYVVPHSGGAKMTTYRLRAELPPDIDRFATELKRVGLTVAGWRVDPDNDEILTFESCAPIEAIRFILASVVDGHVMSDTLAPLQKYTGDRVRRPWAELVQSYEMACEGVALDERRAIVGWLRDAAKRNDATLLDIADAIERQEHWADARRVAEVPGDKADN